MFSIILSSAKHAIKLIVNKAQLHWAFKEQGGKQSWDLEQAEVWTQTLPLPSWLYVAQFLIFSETRPLAKQH